MWRPTGVATGHFYRGQLPLLEDDWSVAEADFTRAIEHGLNDSLGYYRRAITHAKIGQYREAAADAYKAMEMEGDHGLVGEYAARAYAQTVHAVREDESLKADERLELASRYTDRSLEILRRTVAHGFKDLDRMAPGSDLDPVRLDTRFE